MPFERRTRAILRSAEFGFFGVMVRTTVQTPRFWGAPFGRTEWRPFREFHVRRRAGVSTFLRWGFRPFRISCEVVGTGHSFYYRSITALRAKTRTCGHASLTSPPGSGTPAEASVPGVARPHSQDRERADTRNEGPEGPSPPERAPTEKYAGPAENGQSSVGRTTSTAETWQPQ